MVDKTDMTGGQSPIDADDPIFGGRRDEFVTMLDDFMGRVSANVHFEFDGEKKYDSWGVYIFIEKDFYKLLIKYNKETHDNFRRF